MLRGELTRADVVPATLLTLVAVALTFSGEGGNADTLLDTLTVLFVTVPLLWRRSAPLAVAAAVAVGMVVSGAPTFDQTRCAVSIPTGMLAVFSVASRTAWQRALAAWVMCSAGFAFVCVSDPILEGDLAAPLAVGAGLIALAGVGGVVAGIRRRLTLALRERSAVLAERRERTAALAVELERTRLDETLREVARARVEEIVSLADDERGFAEIERLARATLNEMRDMLGVLRTDARAGDEGNPTLAQLDGLLEAARMGGRAVDLRSVGERPVLGALVELAAYRMIEHGLNAVADATTVDIRYGDGGVAVEVAGTAAPGATATAALAAARERAALRGGTVTMVARDGLGLFRAWLPEVA